MSCWQACLIEDVEVSRLDGGVDIGSYLAENELGLQRTLMCCHLHGMFKMLYDRQHIAPRPMEVAAVRNMRD